MPKLELGNQELFYDEKGTGETLLIYPDHLHASRGYEREIDYYAERFHEYPFMWSNPAAFRTVVDLFLSPQVQA